MRISRISGKYRVVLLALTAVMGLTAPQPAAAGDAPVDLAVHRALYSFKMLTAETGAGINGVKGNMYFEQDDACDAWTTDRRFTTEYQYVDIPPYIDSRHYVAFESKDRRQFSFSSEREEDGEMTEQLRGSVEIAGDGAARAVYSRPDDLGYDLPKGYLLPALYTIETIRRARAGDHFFSTVLFDGTDADGPMEIGTFIGKRVSAGEIKKISGADKNIDVTLLAPDAWHIRMAVFPLQDDEESTPSYEMDAIMHDNGVVSYARVFYKTFSVEQRLTALEKLPAKKCSQARADGN
jgi:hypothetical protein